MLCTNLTPDSYLHENNKRGQQQYDQKGINLAQRELKKNKRTEKAIISLCGTNGMMI